MNTGTTRVWLIDGTVVVAETIYTAVVLWAAYYDYCGEINSITAIEGYKNGVEAIIEER